MILILPPRVALRKPLITDVYLILNLFSIKIAGIGQNSDLKLYVFINLTNSWYKMLRITYQYKVITVTRIIGVTTTLLLLSTIMTLVNIMTNQSYQNDHAHDI